MNARLEYATDMDLAYFHKKAQLEVEEYRLQKAARQANA